MVFRNNRIEFQEFNEDDYDYISKKEDSPNKTEILLNEKMKALKISY